ncbi:hypothetical protein ACFLWA_06225 [Chloroflexota bacterium]
MGGYLSTVLRTVILDDAAYQEWREPPNLFLRGIILILVVTLVAGLIGLAVNFVEGVRPVDAEGIRDQIDQFMEMQERFNPGMQNLDPVAQSMMDQMVDLIVPMVTDVAQVDAPLPRGVGGFFEAVGTWLTRALVAFGGWLFYGTLVLVTVNLLGGTAKLPDFLGMVSVYAVPGLLAILAPLHICLGIFALIGAIWSIVVYIKATAVASGLDGGRAILAVIAPAIVLWLLGMLVLVFGIVWLTIIIPG